MKQREQAQRNLELFSIFMQKALQSHELREQIPNKADIIFLPENDADLRDANVRLAEKLRKSGKKPVFIKVTYVPETVTVLIPQLELVAAP